jgi:hypothetical protein
MSMSQVNEACGSRKRNTTAAVSRTAQSVNLGNECWDGRNLCRDELKRRIGFLLPNDIEFSGEKEGAQRLTPSPLQRVVRLTARRRPGNRRDATL